MLLCLSLSGPAVAEDQAEELRLRMYEEYRQADYSGAIALGRRVLELQPWDARTMYALSFFFSLNGDVDSSLIWLERTVRNGYADFLHFEMDTDLDAIRSDPRYAEILTLAGSEAVKQNREKALTVTESRWIPVVMESIYDLPKLDVALSFDHQALKIRAEVHDAHFRDGNRAWRYGDGFMINFVAPDEEDSVYSDRFHAYGFALESGTPVTALVNRDGTYYLWKRDEIAPEIEIDSATMTATYLITLPWEYLYPFHPLLEERAGINIRYTSQSDDGSRKQITYLENRYFDSEGTTLRRFAPLRFLYAEDSAPAFTGELKTRLLPGNRLDVTLATWSPTEQEITASLSILDENEKQVWSGSCTELVKPGRSTRWKPVTLPEGTGTYTFVALFGDSTRWEDSFYRYDTEDLAKMRKIVDAPPSEGESLLKTSSRDALRYRLSILEDRISSFSGRSILSNVRRDFDDLRSLVSLYDSAETIYAGKGYLLSAFTSPIDSSLQPFSIVLPRGFDPAKTYHLSVGLHGSGVDEVGFIQRNADEEQENHITIGPRGRDFSGWWRGKDQEDVAHLIRLVKEMFNIDRTLCYGFSMGGYGVWRMSFLYPDLFEAAICIAGTPSARGPDPADDMRTHIGKGKDISYLVIHGTDDHALDIKPTDEFVGMLKEAGYNVTYVRVSGAGHGNFDPGPTLDKWLRENDFK
jgi:hypothetical protein